MSRIAKGLLILLATSGVAALALGAFMYLDSEWRAQAAFDQGRIDRVDFAGNTSEWDLGFTWSNNQWTTNHSCSAENARNNAKKDELFLLENFTPRSVYDWESGCLFASIVRKRSERWSKIENRAYELGYRGLGRH